MIERKGGAMVALGITLTVCVLAGVGHWTLVNWRNWPTTAILVILGIFASIFLLSVKNVKESRSMIWSICLGFCFLMIAIVALFGQGPAI